TPAADEMGPIVERLLAAGPSITVNPLRFDMDGAPFEATLHAEALPQALPAGPIDLRRVDLWRNVLRGNARLTAEKGLVERAVAAVLKSQLASQYADESSIPREAVDTMASAQAGLVLAMLGAQGIVEDGGSVYRAELRLEDGALTINGRRLPLGLF